VMAEASRAVLSGYTLEVDVKVWRYPQRFMDEKRGRATWNRIMGHLRRAERERVSIIAREEGSRCIRSRSNSVAPVLSPLSPIRDLL
jgi:hypothetical protein